MNLRSHEDEALVLLIYHETEQASHAPQILKFIGTGLPSLQSHARLIERVGQDFNAVGWQRR